MNRLIRFSVFYVLLLTSLHAVATPQRYEAQSPAYRMPMLELFTSEGCSSCPPAEKWLNGLVGADYIIPLAFHVTYWNDMGWKDPFSSERYDSRQRATEVYNKLGTLYTPQFVFDGKSLSGGSNIHRMIRETNQQSAPVDIGLTALVSPGVAKVTMRVNYKKEPVKDVGLYLALYENNLVSDVKAGENDGQVLTHDFVVRHLYGPFTNSDMKHKNHIEQDVVIKKNWKPKDLNLVMFAQNSNTGEILQVIRLSIAPK